MIENRIIIFGILGLSIACLVIGCIIVPTGGATLCSRYGQTVGGVKQDCRRCTSSNPCPCGGGGGSTACRCDSTALPNVCYDSVNSGSVAMIVIGVILLVVGIAGLVFLFVVQRSSTMIALGRAKADS